MTTNLEHLAAELAALVPALAEDSATNRAEVLRNKLAPLVQERDQLRVEVEKANESLRAIVYLCIEAMSIANREDNNDPTSMLGKTCRMAQYTLDTTADAAMKGEKE